MALLALTSACASAPKPVQIVQPVAPEARGQVAYTAIEVIVGETARANVERLDRKAAEKRLAAKLPPLEGPASARPVRDEYETLPLAALMPLALEDALGDRNVTGGRPLKITIEIDNLRTANLAAAMLSSSNDQLAGLVSVSDALTGEKLGAFYVDVLEANSGWLRMATRGGEVREKMVATFAEHVLHNL